MPYEPDQRPISRQTILDALAALNRKLDEEGVVGEICVFGGTAMVLAFNARLSTKDVDAIFKPPGIIRRLAAELAESMDLPATWLNDGVKGFVSGAPEYTSEGLPQLSHLRVIRPTAEYLLAMKCMAARAPAYDTQGDRENIIPIPGTPMMHQGMNSFRRPQTLSEAAAWSDDAGKFSFHIRDFLDEFYADPRLERLMDEPPVRREILSDNGLADAYVAAIAEHLSRQFGFSTLAWTASASRILKHPWFAMESHGGRMLLLIESPPAFRERNIFVSADALSRA